MYAYKSGESNRKIKRRKYKNTLIVGGTDTFNSTKIFKICFLEGERSGRG